MPSPELQALLPVEQRLVLSYADSRGRPLLLGLFALDSRLAATVRGAREPVLAQLRLAWWRDQLASPVEARPSGEEVLDALGPWGEAGAGLSSLVDGWENLIPAAELTTAAAQDFAAGRAAAFATLAQALDLSAGVVDCARRAAHAWALADLASKLGNPRERDTALALAAACDWSRPGLPRALRPLQVLHGLAARRQGQRPLLEGAGSLLLALRLGIVGR